MFKQTCPNPVFNGKVDFTDVMVLDNLIRGLYDMDIKIKVLAKDEADCTLDKIRNVLYI